MINSFVKLIEASKIFPENKRINLLKFKKIIIKTEKKLPKLSDSLYLNQCNNINKLLK